MSEDNKGKRYKAILKEARIRELKAMGENRLTLYSYDMEVTIIELRDEVKRLSLKVEKFEKKRENEKNPTNKYTGYDKSKDGVDKLVFILERNKPRMTFIEIVDTLLMLEPELKERWSSVNKSVTNLLGKACKYGAIVKLKKWGNGGDFIYQLP